jgi:hypothetical protein
MNKKIVALFILLFDHADAGDPADPADAADAL